MAEHVRRFTAITHPKIYFNYLFRGTPAIWSLIIENIQKYGEHTIAFLQYFMEKNGTLIAAITAATVTATFISYSTKKVAAPILNEKIHENMREDLKRMESVLQELLKVQSEILLAANPGPQLLRANNTQSDTDVVSYESSNDSFNGNQNEEESYATSSNSNHTPPLSPHVKQDQIIHLRQNDTQSSGINQDYDLRLDNTTESMHIDNDAVSVTSVSSSSSIDIGTEIADTPQTNVEPRRRKSKRSRAPPRKHLMTLMTPKQQQAWDKAQREEQKRAKRQRKLLIANAAKCNDPKSTNPQDVVV